MPSAKQTPDKMAGQSRTRKGTREMDQRPGARKREGERVEEEGGERKRKSRKRRERRR